MAGERILPGLQLFGYWTPGSNGWNEQHSDGLRKLSALTQLSVISRTTSLPGSPLDGAIYIVPPGDANENSVAIWDYTTYDNTTPGWVYFQPTEGMVAYVQDEDAYLRWDENTEAWTYLGTLRAPADLTLGDGANFSNAHFAPNTLVVSAPSGATTNTLTIPSGLTPFSSAHVVNTGTGDVTIAASGVTLQSKGGNLTLSGQYSFASIIPRGADTYLIVGDLS